MRISSRPSAVLIDASQMDAALTWVAQAILDDLTLVTADRVLERYTVRILRG